MSLLFCLAVADDGNSQIIEPMKTARVATGSYVGDGSAGQLIDNLGFTPDFVLVKGHSLTDGDESEQAICSLSSFPDGTAKSLREGEALQPDQILSLFAGGFAVGSSPRVNASDWRYDWLACQSDGSLMTVGSYLGDGLHNRNVELPFEPKYVLVVPHADWRAWQRFETQDNSQSLPFHNSASQDYILRFSLTGFRISGDDEVNATGEEYSYVAFGTNMDRATVGTYTGDDTSGRFVPGLVSTPVFLLLKGDESVEGVHRFADLPAPAQTYLFADQPPIDTGVLSFPEGGFQLGAHETVNMDQYEYHWLALSQQADVMFNMQVDDPAPVVGQEMVFVLRVGNGGPDLATGCRAAVQLPTGLTYSWHSTAAGDFDPVSGIWDVGNVTQMSLMTMTLAAIVDEGTEGQRLNNTVSLLDVDQHDDNPLNDASSASVTIQGADLAISKIVDQPYPAEGDTVTIDITLSNLGPSGAGDILVTDQLPAGLTYVSHRLTQGSYSLVTGVWDVGTLAMGNAVGLEISARVDEDTFGSTIVNTAGITGSSVTDPVVGNNTDSAEIQVRASDLGVSKTVDETAPLPGASVRFTVTVTNFGPHDADDIVVSDPLPAGLAYVGDTPDQGTYDSGSGDWQVGSLTTGATATLLIDAMVTAEPGETIVNTATSTASSVPDPNPDNDADSASLNVSGPDLEVTKAVDDGTPDVGDQPVFTITVENVGVTGATGIAVTDQLPPGLDYVNAVPSQGTYDEISGVWNVGALNQGSSCVLLLTAFVAPGTGGQTLVNTASLTASDQGDANPDNDSATAEVVVQAADLHLAKNVDNPSPNRNDIITFTVLVTNEGPDDATGVAVADTLPEGLVYEGSTTSQGAYDDASGLWSLGALPAGETATLEIEALVQLNVEQGDTAVNTAYVVAVDQEDPDPADNSDSAVLTQQSSDLALSMGVAPPDPDEGGSVVFTLVLRNNGGPSDATNVRVSDLLPAGLEFASWEATAGAYDPIAGDWHVALVAVDVADTLILNATPAAGTAGETLVNNAAIAEVDQPDPDGTNNEASASVDVRGTDLSVTKVVDDPAPTVGDTIVYTLTVDNLGLIAAAGVAVSDPLPAGLDFVSAAASTGAYDSGSGQWTIGGLTAGSGATLDLSAVVAAGTIGETIHNTAAVTADAPGDTNQVNDEATASLVVQGADLALAKSVNISAPNEGETILFTLSVSNLGPDAAAGVEVQDLLPSGLTYLSHTPAAADYDPVTGFWVVGEVAESGVETLFLHASVDAGTGGAVIMNQALVTASAVADPQAANDWDEATVTVRAADISVVKNVDDENPVVGDIVTFTVTVDNAGPNDATGLVISDYLPGDLLYVDDDQIDYDPLTGRWIIGDLGFEQTVVMSLQAMVGPGTAGDTLTNTAALVEVDQADPMPGNEISSVAVVVQPDADLQLVMNVDEPFPDIGDEVAWSITVRNLGPNQATGIVVSDTLQAGLALDFVSVTASQGDYDTPGVWQLGDLDVGQTAVLQLPTTVALGTGGQTLTGGAWIETVDQGDSVPANDGDSVSVVVTSADLHLDMLVDEVSPDEGDEVNFIINLSNSGPDAATGVALRDSLPPGLTYVSSTPSQGDYNPDTGVWQVGHVGTSAGLMLLVKASVDEGTTGQELTYTARVHETDQFDPDPGDDVAVETIAVGGVDLALTKTVDDPTPAEGGTLEYLLTLVNLGPNPGTGIVVADTLPAGVTFLDAVPEGVYNVATGLWTIGSLAFGDTVQLTLTVTVDERTGGEVISNTAHVQVLAQVDPEHGNDTATAAVTVEIPGIGRVLASVVEGDGGGLHPGDEAEVLRLELVNWSVVPDTLTALALDNLTLGPGTQAELDGDWSELRLWLDEDGELIPAAFDNSRVFDGGALAFTGLETVLAPEDTVRVIVTGTASLAARDGDELAVSIAGAAALTFGRDVAVEASWPVATLTPLPVDGHVAAQIGLNAVDPGVFALASTRNLGLDVRLPANGYQADALTELRVFNAGSATAGDISVMEAWADDGDGIFVPEIDQNLGAFAFTGDRWDLTGLDLSLPPGGARVFVTLDVAADAVGNSTVQLGLPLAGVVVAGDNDGPVDTEIVNSYVQVLSGADHLYLAAAAVESGVIHPGATEAVLIHLVVTNTYESDKTLTGLQLTNVSRPLGAAGQAELDGSFSQLMFHADSDGDGQFGGAGVDDVLGAAAFTDGVAVFGGLDWLVPALGTRHLFVTGNIATHLAADGDTLAAVVAGSLDLQFAEPTEFITAWPLDSQAAYVVDGFVAGQVTNHPVPSRTLARGEQDVLGLDCTLPANGYAADRVVKLLVFNNGTALAETDVASMEAWIDDGDGIYDRARDSRLGSFSGMGGEWQLDVADLYIPPGGVRMFVSFDVAAHATGGQTVRLGLPLHGVTTESGNQGPLDEPVLASGILLISDAPLLAQLSLEPAASLVGQDVTVRMDVTNLSPETVSAVTPDPLQLAGAGALELVAGPEPFAWALSVGSERSFTWTYRATAPGTLTLAGSCAGTGDVSGQTLSSLTATSNQHHVYEPVPGVTLAANSNMPLTANLGQEDVTAMTLVLKHEGEPDAAPARLDSLRIGFADGEGEPVTGAAAVSRVKLRQGATTLFSQEGSPSTGAIITLVTAEPVVLTAGEQAVLSLQFDVAPDATAADFRMTIEAASWVAMSDVVASAAVDVSLEQGEFPFRTETVALVAGAELLTVNVADGTASQASQGQARAPLLALELSNLDGGEQGAAIQLGALPVCLVDSLSVLVPMMTDVLTGISVESSAGLLLARAIQAGDGGLVLLELGMPLLVPQGETVTLSLFGDVATEAAVGEYRMSVPGDGEWDVRDANSGEPVAVSLDPDPLQGEVVEVMWPATTLTTGATSALPVSLTIGAQDVAVMSIVLEHPGAPHTADIALDSLKVSLSDVRDEPLSAGQFLGAVSLLRAGAVVAEASLVPLDDDMVTLLVADQRLACGETAEYTLLIDLKSTAPADTIGLWIGEFGLHAVDANLEAPVEISLAEGLSWPLASDKAVLRDPSDELVASFVDLMPVLLSPLSAETVVAELVLRNPAPPTAGDLELQEVILRGADTAGQPLALGEAVAYVLAYLDDELWATSDALAKSAATAVLRPDVQVLLGPGEEIDLELRLVVAETPGLETLRVGLAADDIVAAQPHNPQAAVSVLPAAGESFPFWTESSGFAGLALEDSYSNFPNPFAAGREPTTFVFALPRPGRVSLKLYTPRGEVVGTLLAGEQREADIYQDQWDGRNGRGEVVHNGVYLAELVVEYTDGGRERLLRKVAVVR